MSVHPFQPPTWSQKRNNGSSRSREAPMDFEYTVHEPSSGLLEPPRKRPHQDLEPMDWEPIQRSGGKGTKKDLWGGLGSSKPTGAAFLFQPPEGMMVDCPPAPPAGGSSNAEQGEKGEGESLVRLSDNGVKHERRRRVRSRRQRRMDDVNEDTSDGSDTDSPPSTVRSRRGGRPTHTNLSLYGSYLSAPFGAPAPEGLRHDTPLILLGYLDLFIRGAVCCIGLYLVSALVFAFARDVTHKASSYSTEIRQEILHCAAQYQANRCDPPSQRTSFTEAACQGWEHCMNRDPETGVGRLRMGAEALSEVVEGFVGGLSWRTAGFLLALVLISAFTLRSTSAALASAASYPSQQPQVPAPSSHFGRPSAFAPQYLPQNGENDGSGFGWQPGVPLSFGPFTRIGEPSKDKRSEGEKK